jgi:hypothetical protein
VVETIVGLVFMKKGDPGLDVTAGVFLDAVFEDADGIIGVARRRLGTRF